MAVHPQKLRLTHLRDPSCFRPMKKILSLLLCFVFLQAETFALRGGPGGAGSRKFTGSYSGVITEVSGSGLGLFLLDAKSTGSSSGSIVFFAQNTTGAAVPGVPGFGATAGGRYYAGTITGLVNPTTGEFSGLFNATTQVSTSTGAVAVVTTISIAGTMKLSISTGTATGNTQLITGTAAAQTSSSTSASQYTISGWQTSSEAVGGGFGQVTSS
jgi:hypothetical protein